MTPATNKRHSNLSFTIHPGSSSILLIFVTLCLVSFATLTLTTTNADYLLTSKVSERITAYYSACNDVERSLASFDLTLARIYHESASSEEYFSTVGTTKSFIVPISDLQSLKICIEILYPTEATDSFYQITSWKIITMEPEENE